MFATKIRPAEIFYYRNSSGNHEILNLRKFIRLRYVTYRINIALSLARARLVKPRLRVRLSPNARASILGLTHLHTHSRSRVNNPASRRLYNTHRGEDRTASINFMGNKMLLILSLLTFAISSISEFINS